MMKQLLIELTPEEWNEGVDDAQSHDPDWGPNLRYTNLHSLMLNNRNLSNADLRDTTLDYVSLADSDLTNARVNYATTVLETSFLRTNLTGVDIDSCYALDLARNLDRAFGYTPPLPVVTEDVARLMLKQAINEEMPEVCEGLREMQAEGLRIQWRDDKLHFWLVQEIQRYRDDCEAGHCSCHDYIEHACEGGCECCSCYRGECDCEPEHEHNVEPTDEWYLATIIGHIQYRWNDYHGLVGDIHMSEQSKHPHVSQSGSICWGDAQIPQTLKAADYLMTVMGWVGQHNPVDPYREIQHDLPLIRKGY